MVEQHALVVAIQHHQAQVEIVRQKPCGICGQTRGCGVSIWGKLFGHQTNSFAVDNALKAQVGDMVLLAVEDGAVLSSATMAYGLPLALLLIGAACGQQFLHLASSSDANSLMGALLGFLLGYGLLRRRVNGLSYLSKYQPHMIKVLSPSLNSSQ